MVMQAVTLGALLLAALFAVTAWRLARQEKRRSAARVAILADAIDGVTPRAAGLSASGVAAVQPDFLTHERPAVSAGRGLLKLAIGFAASVAVIVTVATVGSSSHAQRSTPSAAVTTADSSLELLSMKHEREGDALTVTGLVRNGGNAAAQRLIAVVFAFDRDGNFVASGRAPLEFLSLAPGDESPFRVSVPNVGDVDRYRVSFRSEAGVVRHVDQRQQLLASK
jgi:hypothetical protein